MNGKVSSRPLSSSGREQATYDDIFLDNKIIVSKVHAKQYYNVITLSHAIFNKHIKISREFPRNSKNSKILEKRKSSINQNP